MSRLDLHILFLAVVTALGFAPIAEAHYSPTQGRWVERDPIGYADGCSLYVYGSSTPTLLRDSSGLCPSQKDLAAIDDEYIACRSRCFEMAPLPQYLCKAKCEKSHCARLAATLPTYPSLPDTAPQCDDYKEDDTYKDANARCFCRCAGNGDWSKDVRGCLRALYDCGIDPDLAHVTCYAAASCKGYSKPNLTLAYCYVKCVAVRIPSCIPALPTTPIDPFL